MNSNTTEIRQEVDAGCSGKNVGIDARLTPENGNANGIHRRVFFGQTPSVIEWRNVDSTIESFRDYWFEKADLHSVPGRSSPPLSVGGGVRNSISWRKERYKDLPIMAFLAISLG
jgi:hypothetical protein